VNARRTRFVSEAIEPATDSMDATAMARGEPAMPKRFTWRDKEYTVETVLEAWKETSPCRHGSGEQYVRKHWFRVRTTAGDEMKVYFERQPKSKRERKRRWWLHTVATPDDA